VAFSSPQVRGFAVNFMQPAGTDATKSPWFDSMHLPASPISLHRISGGVARVRTAIGAGRVWRESTGAGHWSRLELRWSRSRDAAARKFALRSACGRISLKDTELLHLGSGIALDDAWPADVFRDAARLACACMHEQLVAALGGPFELQSAEPSSEIELMLMLRPSQGQGHHMLSLSAAAETFTQLLEDTRWEPLDLSKPLSWFDELVCSADLTVAATHLSVRALRAIEAGDLIVASDSASAPDGLFQVQMGDAVLAIALEQADSNMAVCHSWRTSKMASREAFRERASTLHGEDEGSFPVDSVEVAVQFVAGRIELSVGELRALHVASLIQLNSRAGARVDIVANGARVGVGEMVDIDGRLAIEVVELCRPS
jgi:type III secretion protein Q